MPSFSVRLPMELAIAKPGLIALLDYTSFYWPPWNPWGVAQLYRSSRCMMPNSMGVHLWETKMWARYLTPHRTASELRTALNFARP